MVLRQASQGSMCLLFSCTILGPIWCCLVSTVVSIVVVQWVFSSVGCVIESNVAWSSNPSLLHSPSRLPPLVWCTWSPDELLMMLLQIQGKLPCTTKDGSQTHWCGCPQVSHLGPGVGVNFTHVSTSNPTHIKWAWVQVQIWTRGDPWAQNNNSYFYFSR
jgi:hypothetical protein